MHMKNCILSGISDNTDVGTHANSRSRILPVPTELPVATPDVTAREVNLALIRHERARNPRCYNICRERFPSYPPVSM